LRDALHLIRQESHPSAQENQPSVERRLTFQRRSRAAEDFSGRFHQNPLPSQRGVRTQDLEKLPPPEAFFWWSNGHDIGAAKFAPDHNLFDDFVLTSRFQGGGVI